MRGFGSTSSEAAWVGELSSNQNIPLRKPGTQAGWRVTIEEWERILGDPADLGEQGSREWERRLVYADEFLL